MDALTPLCTATDQRSHIRRKGHRRLVDGGKLLTGMLLHRGHHSAESESITFILQTRPREIAAKTGGDLGSRGRMSEPPCHDRQNRFCLPGQQVFTEEILPKRQWPCQGEHQTKHWVHPEAFLMF